VGEWESGRVGEWESCVSLRFGKAIAETSRLRRLNFQDNLKSKIQNLKLIDCGPHYGYAMELRLQKIKEEAARVARKSSCTPSASLRPLLRQQK